MAVRSLGKLTSAIAMSKTMYHLRDVIFDARIRWETERVSQGQFDVHLEKCVQYLERFQIFGPFLSNV